MKNRLILLFFLCCNILSAKISFDYKKKDTKSVALTITFALPPGDFLYHDYLQVSTDHPHAILTENTFSVSSKDYYDPAFNQTKKIFNQSVQLNTTIQCTKEIVNDIYIYVTYYQKSNKKIAQKLFCIANKKKEPKEDLTVIATTIDPIHKENPPINKNFIKLDSLIPWYIMYSLLTLFCLFFALFLFAKLKKIKNYYLHFIINCLAIVLIIFCVILSAKTFQHYVLHKRRITNAVF